MELNTSLGTGLKTAGCRGCGNVFVSVNAFDKHQRLTRQGLVCLDPAEVGLVRKPNGRWGYGGMSHGYLVRMWSASVGVNDRDENETVSATAA